ncbi:geranylgeranyl transferase type-1 subunit beta [Coccinella septempunctata]|uniref:geranylgeranyl transferase type-1 subunit beta n=1 Tax=Coccinella septempunctata TaxID=41139 RepID=UPI001D092BA1|nr:geranylgeranyl transferase type-1 subunit beta [Coccinella septempunctata]
MNELNLVCPEFQPKMHKKLLKHILREIPRNDGSSDANRVVIAHFAVLGLGILGELESLSEGEKEKLINWIYSLQVVDDEELVSGFQGSSIMNTKENKNKNSPYKWGHITNTYSSLAILLLLGDNLSKVDKKAILLSLRALQNDDGSFTATRLGGTESDMRFVFCAASICYILNDWSGIDMKKMIEYIHNCVSYEQAFGQVPDSESHSGSTFCALASLFLSDNMDKLSDFQKHGLLRWLVNKVDFGFSGRTNKPVDTCYSFWTGGSLHLLGAYKLIAPYERQRHKLMFAQHRNGGLSKYEYYPPDPLHTSLGLAGLSMMKIDPLEEVYVPLVITNKAYEHLKNLHAQWSQSK